MGTDSIDPGPSGTDLGNVVRQVLLGTLNVTAGSIPGQVTTFTLAKFAASPGNTPKNTHGYDLDITNNGASPPPAYTGAISSQFTVTAIPEPSSLIFAGLGALITICSHARRCRRG